MADFNPLDAYGGKTAPATTPAGQPLDYTPPTPGATEVIKAGLRRQSIFAQDWGKFLAVEPEGPLFDPFKGDYLKGYEDQMGAFTSAYSFSEAERIKRKIDRERADQQTLMDAGGWGLGAEILGSVLNPSTLVPFGGAARAGGLYARALKGSTALAVPVAAEELALQGFQETRTNTETFMGIAAPAALGAGFGIWRGGARLSDDFGETANEFFREARQTEEAAKTTATFEGRVVSGEARQAESVGAAGTGARTGSYDEQLAEEGLKTDDWLTRQLAKLPDTPLKRTLMSQELRARELAQSLVETPYILGKNKAGIATETSVEGAMRRWKWTEAEALTDIDSAYMAYRGRAGQDGFIGKARLQFDDAFRGARGEALSPVEFRQAVSYAMRRGDTHVIPEVEQAAKAVRNKLFEKYRREGLEDGFWTHRIQRRIDELEDEVRAAGKADQRAVLEIEDLRNLMAEMNENFGQPKTARSFVPRLWRIDRIVDNYGDLHDRLVRHYRSEGIKDADKLATDTIQKLLRERGFERFSPDEIGTARSFKERTLTIPDEMIEDFLENDIEQVLRFYNRTMSADIELYRKFGTINLEDQIRELQDNWMARIGAATDVKARATMKNRMDADLRDIRALRDRLRGIYGLPEDPLRWQSRAMRLAKQFNYMTMLGGVAVSAIPDMARIVMVDGFSRALGSGLRPLIANMAAWKMAAREAQVAGTALDMVLSSRALAFADLGDTFGRHSRLERGMAIGANAFSMVNLLNPWNSAMKQMAGVVIASKLLDHAKKMAAGTLKQSDIEKMARAGIDADTARRIAKEFDEHGEVVDGAWLPNTAGWTDDAARRAFHDALAADVDRAIVTPGVGDRPLWASTELGSLVAQFKSFAFAATQRILMAGLQERDRHFFSGVALMVGMGVLVDQIKRAQYGDKRDQTVRGAIAAGIDRAGILGYFSDINRVVEKWSDNRLGVSAALGVAPPYHNSTRTKVGAAAGPTATQLARIAEVLGDFGSLDPDAGTASALRRLAPANNVFWMMPAFDAMEAGMREAFE